MFRSRSIQFIFIVVPLYYVLVGCSSKHVYWEEDYYYPSLGLGPGPVVGGIILKHGNEESIISEAIITSLQSMNHSIIKPDFTDVGFLAQRAKWETDIVPLSGEEIKLHNSKNPNLELSESRKWGVKYKGMYFIMDYKMKMKIESELYSRGAATNFREYSSNEFSGMFFFKRLKDKIHHNLVSNGQH